MLVVLVVLSGFVWTKVFDSLEDIETATRCNVPSPPTASPASPGQQQPQVPLGTMLPRNALDRTSPVPPQEALVRVLNGNGESNEASLISEQLSSLGFGQGGEADNDPVYTNYDLNCHGQIRFGDAGAGAARTLSLIVPCAQLVRDERPDASVDLALGAEFDDIRTTSEAKQVLQELKTRGEQEQEGDVAQEATPPRIDSALLEKARDVHC